ncbi:MAG: NUDIX domain-containing protein [Bacteroidales bacterium]
MNAEYHPQNVFQYCPSCGAQNLCKHSFKSIQCASCGFLFFVNPAAAVAAVIINSADEVLLTKRAFEPAKGMYDLPGGFVDPGETAEHALKREIAEELHVDVTAYSYFASFPNEYVYNGLLYYTVDMVYFCDISSTQEMCPADDVSDVIFLPISETLISQVGLPSIKNILYAVKNRIESLA